MQVVLAEKSAAGVEDNAEVIFYWNGNERVVIFIFTKANGDS